MSSPAELTGNTPPLVYDGREPITGDAMRWAKAIDGWTEAMRAQSLRPLTIELRRYQIGALAEAHLRRSPWSVRTTDLIGWLNRQDWAPETRKSYRAALGSFYGWAREAGHIRRNPAAKLPAVTVPRGVPRPAPEAILDAALSRATDRDRLILTLAAYAGLRRAEIAGLRWRHITDGTLRVIGKGGHVRLVPIHKILVDELELERARRDTGAFGSGYRYAGHPDGPWVFPGQSGHITAQAVGKSAARALGDGYTGHTLRHRFASRVYANTHDLPSVQQLLGHTNPTTTTIYAKADDTALRAAVDAL